MQFDIAVADVFEFPDGVFMHAFQQQDPNLVLGQRMFRHVRGLAVKRRMGKIRKIDAQV